MGSIKNEASGIEVDEKVFKRLAIRIIAMERRNLKTKKYNQRELNSEIADMIEREVLK